MVNKYVATSQQTQNFCIAFVQRRPNVFAIGPTLYKCYTNVLCLLSKVQLSISACLHYWERVRSRALDMLISSFKPSRCSINPFTTEARFYVLNAIAFST